MNEYVQSLDANLTKLADIASSIVGFGLHTVTWLWDTAVTGVRIEGSIDILLACVSALILLRSSKPLFTEWTIAYRSSAGSVIKALIGFAVALSVFQFRTSLLMLAAPEYFILKTAFVTAAVQQNAPVPAIHHPLPWGSISLGVLILILTIACLRVRFKPDSIKGEK